MNECVVASAATITINLADGYSDDEHEDRDEYIDIQNVEIVGVSRHFLYNYMVMTETMNILMAMAAELVAPIQSDGGDRKRYHHS